MRAGTTENLMSPIAIKFNICPQDEKGVGGGGAERRLNNICMCVCDCVCVCVRLIMHG